MRTEPSVRPLRKTVIGSMSENRNGTPGFEERLQQVQEMTARIESGALPLEDSVKQFEKGMKILSELGLELEDMKRRLTVLRDGKETEVSNEDA